MSVSPVLERPQLKPLAVEDRGANSNRWLVLVIVCLAQFMVVLDATIVNVALPSIQHALNFSQASLQWVVNAYTLVFGGFLLLGGRAGDLIGRKRLFIIGVALFSFASLLNGLAQTSGMLIAGRALQGLGAALLSPAALSIITTTFPDQQERTKALGVWSGIAAGGAAFGLLLGGILTQLLSWEWIFFVNVPVGIGAMLAAFHYVPESRGPGTTRGFDLAGATSVTSGLVILVYAIVQTQTHGWGSLYTLVVGGVGIALLIAFLFIESRSNYPLMRLSIFKVRSLAVADGALLLVGSGMFSMFFFASLYVQEVLGYSPLRAGLAFLPVCLGIVIGAGAAQQLIRQLGVRGVSVIGVLVAAGGLAWLIRLPVHGSYLPDLLAGLLPMAIGLGLVFVPITLLATSGVGDEDAGLASGLFNTAQQVGGSLGLAILSTLAVSHTTNLMNAGGITKHAAEVSGYHVAFAGAAIMLAIAGLLLAVLLRRKDLAHVDVNAPLTAVA